MHLAVTELPKRGIGEHHAKPLRLACQRCPTSRAWANGNAGYMISAYGLAEMTSLFGCEA
eukprot:1491570-Amphidinium_carterae.3